MADESFEKLDQELMKGLKEARERRVPEEALKGFSDSVAKRILERKNRKPAFGFPAWVVIPAFALLAGAGLWYWMGVKVPQTPSPENLKMRPQAVPSVPGIVPETRRVAAPAKELISTPTAPAANPISLPALQDSDIADEIEALKELGEWTEEDEEVIEIPLEESFTELEGVLDTENIPLRATPQSPLT